MIGIFVWREARQTQTVAPNGRKKLITGSRRLYVVL